MNKQEQAEYYRNYVLPKYNSKPTVEDYNNKLENLKHTKEQLLRMLRKVNTDIAAIEGYIRLNEESY